MHRAEPNHSSFRAYVAGGARATVNTVDDSKLMQEHASDFMSNESRSAIESPQNYGFTSVAAAASKDANGNVTGCAETFISFMGGNRSFPVAGNMDDRRHRLQKLQPGDTAMFRQRDDKQQFHMTTDGGFWTGPRDKTLRMQLLDEDSGSQQQQGGQGGSGGSGKAGDSGSGGGAGTFGSQQNGQQARYKDGQNSYRYVHCTQNESAMSGVESHMKLQDGDSYVHCTGNKTYLGGHASKHRFALVVTTDGPSYNSYARISGRAEGEDEDADPVILGEGTSAFDDLVARIAALEARVATLEEKLG